MNMVASWYSAPRTVVSTAPNTASVAWTPSTFAREVAGNGVEIHEVVVERSPDDG